MTDRQREGDRHSDRESASALSRETERQIDRDQAYNFGQVGFVEEGLNDDGEVIPGVVTSRGTDVIYSQLHEVCLADQVPLRLLVFREGRALAQETAQIWTYIHHSAVCWILRGYSTGNCTDLAYIHHSAVCGILRRYSTGNCTDLDLHSPQCSVCDFPASLAQETAQIWLTFTTV